MGKKFKGKRKVALFDVRNKFVRYCTIKEANEKLAKGDGYFTDTRVMKLKYSVDAECANKKEQVRKKDRRTCYICGKHIHDKEDCTVDHVIPVSRTSNPWTQDNMRCCCSKCNVDKDSMTLKEYVDHIEKNRRKYMYISTRRLNDLKEYAEQQEKAFVRTIERRNAD